MTHFAAAEEDPLSCDDSCSIICKALKTLGNAKNPTGKCHAHLCVCDMDYPTCNSPEDCKKICHWPITPPIDGTPKCVNSACRCELDTSCSPESCKQTCQEKFGDGVISAECLNENDCHCKYSEECSNENCIAACEKKHGKNFISGECGSTKECNCYFLKGDDLKRPSAGEDDQRRPSAVECRLETCKLWCKKYGNDAAISSECGRDNECRCKVLPETSKGSSDTATAGWVILVVLVGGAVIVAVFVAIFVCNPTKQSMPGEPQMEQPPQEYTSEMPAVPVYPYRGQQPYPSGEQLSPVAKYPPQPRNYQLQGRV